MVYIVMIIIIKTLLCVARTLTLLHCSYSNSREITIW